MPQTRYQTRWWIGERPFEWLRGRAAHLPRSLRTAGAIVLVAIAYFVAGTLGLSLGPLRGFAALVWPPTGIALSALLLGGTRLWPGVFIGAILVNASAGAPPAVAGVMGCGNTLEALLGVHLLRRACFDGAFGRIKDVVLLILVAALAALVSATVGVGALLLDGTVPRANADTVWFAWWWGNIMGVLVVTPLILTCAGGSWRQTLRRWREAAAVFATLLVTALLVFGIGHPTFARAYFLFPPLIWVALRFGPLGSALGMALVSTCAIAATAMRHGPFVEMRLSGSLTSLQLFLGVAATTTLLLAASIKERGARDELMAVAAHELRNPITGMRLQLERMQRGLDQQWPAERLAQVSSKLVAQLTRLQNLVEILFDLARTRTVGLSLQTENFDLANVVQETVAGMSDALAKAECEVELRLESAHGCWDRLRVAQVVSILLTNAMTHAPGKPITITLKIDNNLARLTVQDRGRGVPERDRLRIFEPYQRASGEPLGKGLGLGLHIARQIVVALHGTIWVEGEPGGGAVFITELPLNSADAAAVPWPR